MTYDFSKAENFSLVTSNAAEVKEIQESMKRQEKDPRSVGCVIWVIEGRDGRKATGYTLREVFHPNSIQHAVRGDYSGARKDFLYTIDGVGESFGEGIILNNLPWFASFLEDNGNFGFGLRFLRDQYIKEEFLKMVRPYFRKTEGRA